MVAQLLDEEDALLAASIGSSSAARNDEEDDDDDDGASGLRGSLTTQYDEYRPFRAWAATTLAVRRRHCRLCTHLRI